MVTIVVLIILATVSLNLVLGENGIITKAKGAKEVQEIANEKERFELVIPEVILDKQNGNIAIEDYMNKIEEKGMIDQIIEESDTIREIVTDKGFIAKIEDKGNGNIEITIIGKEEELPPRIIKFDTKTTSYTIEIMVGVRKPEEVSYAYYIRKNGESEYRKIEDSNNTTCYIENLEPSMKYDIKVEATNKKGTSRREKTVTTDSTVTITFNANGGIGGPGAVELEVGASYTPTNPTKSYTSSIHYTFTKWSTNQDGSGDTWNGIVPNNATTYYAQYTQASHSFQYRNNGNGTHQKYCNCGYSITESHTYVNSSCICGQKIGTTLTLFDNGNEATSVTGGWKGYKQRRGIGYAGIGGGVISIANHDVSDDVTVSTPNNDSGLRTTNTINTTPYRYLKAKIDNATSAVTTYNVEGYYLVVDNDTNADNGQILKQEFRSTGIVTADLSSINGRYYIAIVAGYNRINCSKVWLE